MLSAECLQDSTHLSIIGVKTQMKDHPGKFEVALTDKQFHFATESDCGLWIQAFEHAMAPSSSAASVASPLAVARSPVSHSPGTPASLNSPVARMNYSIFQIFQYHSSVLMHAAEIGTSWESLAHPLSIVEE